jgi:glycerol uptake facilitator-like aquaporin
MLVEMFFTFILVSIVLFVKYRAVTSTSDGMLSNCTVAIAIYVCVVMASPLSGGGLNPTFSLAIITTHLIVDAVDTDVDHSKPEFLVPYIIGQLIGGIFAALMLKITMMITPPLIEDSAD